MNSLSQFCALLLVAIATGCATPAPPPPLSATEVAAIDYGTFPDNYQQLIRDYFAQTLPNANTAQFRFGEPLKGYLQHGPLFGGKVFMSGYFVDVWLKSAPQQGVESEQHVGVAIKNGEVLMQLSPEEMQQVKR